MKVFQIKSIVPNLINRSCSKLSLANFKLNNEKDVLDEQYAVNSFPKARNYILEIDTATRIGRAQRLPQEFDLPLPCIQLGFFYA